MSDKVVPDPHSLAEEPNPPPALRIEEAEGSACGGPGRENVAALQTFARRTLYTLLGACMAGSMLIGGCIALIFLYVIKAKVSPGAPATCKTHPVSPAGHPAIQVHDVLTKDGMTLHMWRVPSVATVKPRRPVLIMHGFECSARDWFAGLDADALPWLMWRAGFDVWVGNNRGNFLTETPKWDWTLLEMADIDLPAMVDTILADTAAQSLVYVGHSLGGLQAFMHFSENATTAKRISHFVALAPAVYLTQQRYSWNVLSTLYIDDIVSLATARPGTSFTVYEEMQRDKCYGLSFVGGCFSCGRDMGGSFMEGTEGFAASCWEKFYCIPAGTSSDTLRVFADALRAGGFQAYLQGIGRAINFTALTMPIAFAAGEGDLFMKPADVQKIQSECTRSASKFLLLKDAGHLDLVWGKEAPTIVYRPILKWLNATETPVVVVDSKACRDASFLPVVLAIFMLHVSGFARGRH